MSIHYLTMTGQISEIQKCLSQDLSLLNAIEEGSGETPLMVAIIEKQLEIANFFLGLKDIDIYVKARRGENVLHFLLWKISQVRSTEREGYYNIAEKILLLEARDRIRNPTMKPLLEKQDNDGYPPLLMIDLPECKDIRRRILDIARRVEEQAQAELKEREDRKETARLQLYSEKSPSILKERNKEEKLSHWSFSSLFSMCGIWGKKHDRRSTLSELQELEPEREKLLEKKTV